MTPPTYDLTIKDVDETGHELVLHSEGNMELDTMLVRIRYYTRTGGPDSCLHISIERSG